MEAGYELNFCYFNEKLRVEALEKFEKIILCREPKIMELKKEIKGLEIQLYERKSSD